MQRIRREHRYFDEVHWREIGSASPKSRHFLVARDWMEFYLRVALRGCPFKAFVAEDGPNRRFPYPGDPGYPEHLLQSTKAALKAGVAWSFYRERKLRLDLVFDDTDNELERSVANEVPDVLQSECNTRRASGSKRYPWLRVSPVRFLSSDPKKIDDPGAAPYCEFIQLCDLLLGASFQALQLSSEPRKQAGRRQLAKSIMGVLAETLQVPWFQQIQVHRKFSVSLYPDRFNFAYPVALRMVNKPIIDSSLYLPTLEPTA